MIRFPKMHIAKSAVNRILNVADEIDVKGRLDAVQLEMPSIPEGNPEGALIQAELSKPTPEVSAPPGIGVEQMLGPEKIL